MKKSGIIIFLFGLITALSVVKAMMHNRLSTSGVFVGQVEEQISFYKTQNAILSEKVLTLSSLTNISARATELGFVKDDSLMILNSSRPLAIKP